MLLHLDGSRVYSRKLRPPRLIVSRSSLSSSPILLMLFQPANFLRINVYLTQKIGEDMLWNIAVNDAGADYDPLTLLRSRTMFGRPDWKTIFGQMRQAIESGQYLPGSTSQLKTKVGVSSPSLLMSLLDTYDSPYCRHTSVDQELLQKLSRRLVSRIPARPLSSPSLRFVSTSFYVDSLSWLINLHYFRNIFDLLQMVVYVVLVQKYPT